MPKRRATKKKDCAPTTHALSLVDVLQQLPVAELLEWFWSRLPTSAKSTYCQLSKDARLHAARDFVDHLNLHLYDESLEWFAAAVAAPNHIASDAAGHADKRQPAAGQVLGSQLTTSSQLPITHTSTSSLDHCDLELFRSNFERYKQDTPSVRMTVEQAYKLWQQLQRPPSTLKGTLTFCSLKSVNITLEAVIMPENSGQLKTILQSLYSYSSLTLTSLSMDLIHSELSIQLLTVIVQSLPNLETLRLLNGWNLTSVRPLEQASNLTALTLLGMLSKSFNYRGLATAAACDGNVHGRAVMHYKERPTPPISAIRMRNLQHLDIGSFMSELHRCTGPPQQSRNKSIWQGADTSLPASSYLYALPFIVPDLKLLKFSCPNESARSILSCLTSLESLDIQLEGGSHSTWECLGSYLTTLTRLVVQGYDTPSLRQLEELPLLQELHILDFDGTELVPEPKPTLPCRHLNVYAAHHPADLQYYLEVMPHLSEIVFCLSFKRNVKQMDTQTNWAYMPDVSKLHEVHDQLLDLSSVHLKLRLPLTTKIFSGYWPAFDNLHGLSVHIDCDTDQHLTMTAWNRHVSRNLSKLLKRCPRHVVLMECSMTSKDGPDSFPLKCTGLDHWVETHAKAGYLSFDCCYINRGMVESLVAAGKRSGRGMDDHCNTLIIRSICSEAAANHMTDMAAEMGAEWLKIESHDSDKLPVYKIGMGGRLICEQHWEQPFTKVNPEYHSHYDEDDDEWEEDGSEDGEGGEDESENGEWEEDELEDGIGEDNDLEDGIGKEDESKDGIGEEDESEDGEAGEHADKYGEAENFDIIGNKSEDDRDDNDCEGQDEKT